MNYKCHRVAGLCAGLSYCFISSEVNPPTNPTALFNLYSAVLLASQLGSIIPDIDHPNSFVGKHFKTLSKSFNTLFGHRGMFHYPIFLLCIIVIMHFSYNSLPEDWRYLYVLFCKGFVIGYISHIFLDLFNSKGVKLLKPIINYNFKIPTGIKIKKKKRKKLKRDMGRISIKFTYLNGSNKKDQIIINFLCIFGMLIIFYFYIIL